MDLAGKFMGGLKSAAGAGLNLLPDRVNLFARYLTGVGNTNLQLDKSTERALINATEKQPTAEALIPTWPDERSAMAGDMSEMVLRPMSVPAAGPGQPASGPTMPYNSGDQTASQTLGRFNAEVTPTTVRAMDTYDMENDAEDPDLVSGKFQPGKAINLLRSTFNPGLEFNRKTGALRDVSHTLSDEQKDFANYMKARGTNTTYSPMTEAARALMYALPVKFNPYEIDYTIQRPQ
jgi:hypothetical protein